MIKKITLIVIIATIAVLIGYDIFAAVTGGMDATISAVLLKWSKEYLVIPFAAGLLCGHLFWSQKQ